MWVFCQGRDFAHGVLFEITLFKSFSSPPGRYFGTIIWDEIDIFFNENLFSDFIFYFWGKSLDHVKPLESSNHEKI